MLIRILDIIWDMFTWRNISDFAQRAVLMWPITRDFLRQKRVQVALMSLAVCLGFSAYLVFQAVLGDQTRQVMAKITPPELPASMVIRHQDKIRARQIQELADTFIELEAAALDVKPLIKGSAQPVLGVPADDPFWASQIEVLAGDAKLKAEQILVPAHLAEEWQVGIGDKLHLTLTGKAQPFYQTNMTVSGIFKENGSFFDRPIILDSASILAEYNLQEPNLLFVSFHKSDTKRALQIIKNTLEPEPGFSPYPWLRPSVGAADWVFNTIRPYTLLWQSDKSGFVQDTAAKLVASNYSSGRGVVALVFLFSAISILNILLISLLTRRRDVGILKTIGYDDFCIFTSFLIEAGVVVGSGILGGAVLTKLAFLLLDKYFSISLCVTWLQIIKTGLLSFVIYMTTAAIPADMARYTSVMELLQERPLRSSWEQDPLYKRPEIRRQLRTVRNR
ncbi:MAG: FtsX-like permease family protein [Firmicutes bacterium]|nr:FtsX-like permease family protein [Bacillota bacterium]